MLRLCPTCHATYEGDERYCIRDATELLVIEADSTPSDERVGTMIGNYRLLAVVGRGGMGTVYAAEHIYLGKRAALKVLHERFAMKAEAVQSFLHEARAASSINHPNIVDIYDFGPTPDGRVYLAMELLAGRELESVLDRDGPMRLHRAINIVYQIASALAAAHDKGIVHSDLKPANVLLTPRPGRRDVIRAIGTTAEGQPSYTVENEGPFDFVKVLDFGIARVHTPDGNPEDAHIFGTPEYMSPEAAMGKDLDGRADVYALGVLFYEMLTGRVPFEAELAMDVLQKQLHDAPVPPRQAAPHAEITAAAEDLILRSLEKDPEHRPGSMDELRAELASCYGTIAFRRDANRVPGGQSFAPPRQRRLTEELDDWLAREKVRIERAVRGDLARAERGDDEGDDDAPPEPLLLTQRKPIG